MRKGSRFSANRANRLFLVGLLAAVVGTGAAAGEAFRVETVTEGVKLYRPVDPDPARTNSLVVERSDGLLVVGAQPSPRAARELLEEIGRNSSSPVRYLVYPHSHVDAAGGGSAFPSSTLVVAAIKCQEALRDLEYDFGAEARARAEEPDNWVEPERRPATLIAPSTIVLDDPIHAVSVHPLGRSTHSLGDSLVRLPGVDLLFVGSLAFSNGNPYAADGNIGTWLSTLNSVLEQRPAFIVGLRGPLQQRADVIRQRDALAWVRGQVEEAFTKLLPLDVIEETVLHAEGIDERFAVDADPSFVATLINRVVEESATHRRKRGRPVVERNDPE